LSFSWRSIGMDAIVIGAGPNGLTAAATLARQGWEVLVLEAKERPGGALYSEPLTLPGYLHDVGAAFFPFAADSPAFRFLDLPGAGLRFANARWESCHPAPDGSTVSIARDIEETVRSFGADGPAWRRLAEWRRAMGPRFVEALLAPFPPFGAGWRLGIRHLLRLGLMSLPSSGTFARWHFRTEAARRVVPGLALHADLGPDDFPGLGIGLVLALLAASSGFPVPHGGARAVTQALLRRLEERGGKVRLSSHVQRILVRQRRVVAVRIDDGEEIAVRRAVLADVGPPALFFRMMEERDTTWWLRTQIRRFRYAWGTFKMDWALSGPVPWLSEEAREAAVVHAGDNLDDLAAFTRQVRGGQLPDNPYLVIGQQSLIDPQRAPPGEHTLYAYSHVPSAIEGGWQRHRESFADRIERRLEGLAPGFRRLIRGRFIATPPDLETMNENLVGGDIGGGSAQFRQQLIFRPAFPYFRYRTPVKGLYLASASTPPGPGVHGACGFNAANAALADQKNV
jgi:phytoene dehydrogenase-like protein